MSAAQPFAKVGARRAAPKSNIVKAVDKAAEARLLKFADMEAKAAGVNTSTLAAAADLDGSGAIDVTEFYEHLKKERGLLEKTKVTKLSASSSTLRSGSSVGARRRAAP
mmetsp:Transcript_21822/g.51779  ORF Transcript_21822/g.51779 Transcript_21822/m.51779 type:complete len:109 (+) Transcript_21822:62-388(+)